MPLYPAPLRLPEPTQADVGFTPTQYSAIETLDRDDNLRDPSDLEGLRRLLARNDLTPKQREAAELGYERATGQKAPPMQPTQQPAPFEGTVTQAPVQLNTIDDARKAMPSLAGLDDEGVVNVLQQVYWPNKSTAEVADAFGVKPPAAPPPPKEGLGTAFGRGIKESFQQLPQLGYGLAAGAAAGAETAFGEGGIATSLKDWSVKKYKEWDDKIAAQAQPSDSLETSWEAAQKGDIGALASWLSHGVGYTGGQAVQALASGGVGLVGGKFVAATAGKQLAEAMVNREIADIMAQGPVRMGADELAALATRNVAAKFANAGAMTAVGGMAYGQEGGQIYGPLAEQSVKEGRPLTGEELARATWATFLSGSLEFAGDKFGLSLMLGKSGATKAAEYTIGVKGRLARGALGAAADVPVEAGTEYFQQGLEAYGAGTEQNMLPFNQSPEAQKQAFEAGALGALGGAVMGGGGGLLSRAKERNEGAARTLAATATALAGERNVAAEAANRLASAPDLPSMTQAASDLAFSSALLPPGLVNAAGAEAATTIDHVRAGVVGEAQASDAPFGDRVLSAQEQLADPIVRQSIAAQFGPDALSNALYYLNAANDTSKNLPDVTRERMLGVAESIISRAVLRPISETPQLPGIGPGPQQIGVNPAPQQVGMDTTPTGRMLTTPEGVTAPETRSDVLSRSPDTAQAALGAREAAQRQTEIAAAGGPGMVTPTPRGESVIDQNAHQAAVSDKNDRVAPTNEQILGVNAQLGHDAETFPGLDLSFENPAGTVRKDLKNKPPKWETLMRHHYGYIKGTKGKDKDHVDVFAKPGTPKGYTGPVYVVDQNNADGSFDEHKVMLGFASEQEAREAYLSNYDKGWESRVRGITALPFDAFKTWVFNPALTVQPLSQGNAHAADATSQSTGAEPEHRNGNEGGQAAEAGGGDRTERPAQGQGPAAAEGQTQGNVDQAAGAVPADQVSETTRERVGFMKRLSVLKSLKECLNG